MAFKLDEKAVLSAFDRLAELGVIRYGPSEAVRLADKGFTVLQ
jgi:Mn-dependent DtxR family transcriptional regulator